MKKILITTIVAFSFSVLFSQSKNYTKEEIEQGENLEQNRQSEDEYGLVVTMGGINGSSGQGGYGLFGNPNSGHVNIDNNEIQGKVSPTAFGTFYINYWGGTTNIGYGSTGPSNVLIGRAANTGYLNAYDALYVDGSTDYVGINENDPITSFHINQAGAGGIYLEGDGAGDARMRISNTGGSHYIFDDASNANALKLETANSFALNTGGVNERMRVDNLGRVAINDGIAGATQLKLESFDYSWGFLSQNFKIVGTAYGVYGEASGTGTGTRYGVYGTAGSSTGNRYGVFGTASTAPANSWAGYFSGDLWYTGSVKAPSDNKLKKNANEMPSVLEKVMLLKPKTYEFKTEEYDYLNLAQGSQYGFFSQEVEVLFPNLVEDNSHAFQTGEAGVEGGEEIRVDIKSLDYMSMIPILTKAIQEQQTEIKDLKTQLEAYEQLEERLEKLEASIKK